MEIFKMSPGLWRFKRFESIKDLEDSIRATCFHLREDPQPLLTLMTCQDARFFLPVLYSILGCCSTCFKTLKKMLEDRCQNGYVQLFLNHFERDDYKQQLVKEMSDKFTFDTIVYCGLLIYSDDHSNKLSFHTYEERVELQTRYWLENLKEYLATCSTFPEVERIILWLAHFTFPVVSTTLVDHYVWDPFAEAWCCIIQDSLEETFLKIYNFMWETTKDFMLREFRELEIWKREFYEDLWSLQFGDPNWETAARDSACFVKNTGIKVSHQNLLMKEQQKSILKMFPKDYECANVPEFYFIERKNFQLASIKRKKETRTFGRPVVVKKPVVLLKNV